MSSRETSPGIQLLVLVGVLVIGAVITALVLGPDSPARVGSTGGTTDLYYYGLVGGFLLAAVIVLYIFYRVVLK
jgi:hypothetical protein